MHSNDVFEALKAMVLESEVHALGLGQSIWPHNENALHVNPFNFVTLHLQ